jgi:hypothetical protein
MQLMEQDREIARCFIGIVFFVPDMSLRATTR